MFGKSSANLDGSIILAVKNFLIKSIPFHVESIKRKVKVKIFSSGLDTSFPLRLTFRVFERSRFENKNFSWKEIEFYLFY